MKRPKIKIGQRVKLDDGKTGRVMSTKAGTAECYLGYVTEKEYFDRINMFTHVVAYEHNGKMISEEIKERL